MKNRQYLVLLSLAVVFILSPVFVHAQTAFVCNSIESCNQVIASLQQQLALLQNRQNNSDTWCHTFNTNLSINMSGEEVMALHQALGQAGFDIARGEKVFFETQSGGGLGFPIEIPRRNFDAERFECPDGLLRSRHPPEDESFIRM